jgi:thioredoxin-related protein
MNLENKFFLIIKTVIREYFLNRRNNEKFHKKIEKNIVRMG